MFWEYYGLDYHQQRHAERVQASERERLVRCLVAAQKAQRGQKALSRRMLAATGRGLVQIGTRLQNAAAPVAH
jgi:hypothetical protein